MLVQTVSPARSLHIPGKRTALARWLRLRRPQPAMDGGEAARRDGFVPTGQPEMSQTHCVWCLADEINVLKGHRKTSGQFHRASRHEISSFIATSHCVAG